MRERRNFPAFFYQTQDSRIPTFCYYGGFSLKLRICKQSKKNSRFKSLFLWEKFNKELFEGKWMHLILHFVPISSTFLEREKSSSENTFSKFLKVLAPLHLSSKIPFWCKPTRYLPSRASLELEKKETPSSNSAVMMHTVCSTWVGMRQLWSLWDTLSTKALCTHYQCWKITQKVAFCHILRAKRATFIWIFTLKMLKKSPFGLNW